ncbi:MAG: lipoyl(octanoyl) transferase LipB [Melioribacteraceae bacterium]|nr:lipoyl(octanoyl) transferase LipB [Melioribacteraceae bacterium]
MANQSISKKLIYSDLDFIDYQEAWDLQKIIFENRHNNNINDIILLLEHPHTYTLGKVADKKNLLFNDEQLIENKISVYEIDRGGDITYHGPGQIVGYPIINLKDWKEDTHEYLRSLEQVIINVCNEYGLSTQRKANYTGVWIEDRKIAAIGIKISRWITMHGFAFNINTNLDYFNGIIPCGIKDKDVTSLEKELNEKISINDVKEKLVNQFYNVFGYSALEIISKEKILNNFLIHST